MLQGRPVIVGGSESQCGLVPTASYEARAWGIHIGMSLVEAKRHVGIQLPKKYRIKKNGYVQHSPTLTR